MVLACAPLEIKPNIAISTVALQSDENFESARKLQRAFVMEIEESYGLDRLVEASWPTTISHLMYLQGAIFAGTFIEVSEGARASELIDILDSLPSGELWRTFVNVVEG